jgi:N-acetylmuramoyl-L-alanine amidase
VTLALLLLSAVVAANHAVVTATLPGGDTVVWQRGATPELLVLPRRGEGWERLAARVAGSAGEAQALRSDNPGMRHPLRGIRVHVPWGVARPELREALLRAVFPHDRRTPTGWSHVVTSLWNEKVESWWEMAGWWCGDAGKYQALREANPSVGLFPAAGTTVTIPEALLAPDLRRVPPPPGLWQRRTTHVSPPPAETSAAPPPAAAPVTSAAPSTAAGSGALEYREGEAIYRLRPGEALYSSVVVRFTGQLHAAEVNATAAELARRSGIRDVTDIPIGYPIRIPFDLLLPEFLPPGDPRRKEWEKDREELAAVRRAIHAANLDGIQIILDAGHGGEDTGAISHGVWESTYVYDVMARVKRVLERQTRATVWATVQDVQNGGRPVDKDVLPQHLNGQRLLVQPPYDLSDSVTGVQLRWVLSNAILARLERQKVDPERVAFVSIHADSLHPAVRGLMVYVPSHSLRPHRGPSPSDFYRCREASYSPRPVFSSRFRSRAEGLSNQLGDAIVDAAKRLGVPVHPYEPVRDSVLRGSSRWVPAVLRYNLVPTSVLVEICNLNNREDRSLLLTWRFREKLAHAIAAGLAEGFAR